MFRIEIIYKKFVIKKVEQEVNQLKISVLVPVAEAARGDSGDEEEKGDKCEVVNSADVGQSLCVLRILTKRIGGRLERNDQSPLLRRYIAASAAAFFFFIPPRTFTPREVSFA